MVSVLFKTMGKALVLSLLVSCSAVQENPFRDAIWIGRSEMPAEKRLVPGRHRPGNRGTVREEAEVPMFRKEFRAGHLLKKATLYISGLGQYEALVNGKCVSGALAPGWSLFDKHILYNEYDVTGLLKKHNVIGVTVGNGFHYVSSTRYAKFENAYGYPKMICCLELEYPLGIKRWIVSGSDWKCHLSPVTYSSIFGGEDYDANLEIPGWTLSGYDDSAWENAVQVSSPGGELCPQPSPQIEVKDTLSSVSETAFDDGTIVFDFAQNASGKVQVKATGEKGAKFRIYPGELLDENGRVTQKASGAPFYCEYTLSGSGEEVFCPKFTYYGQRYAEVVPVSGKYKIQDVSLLHTRADAAQTGRFECSSSLMNRIFNLIDWAIKSNLQSVITDCPHREKLGWLEQDHLMGNSIRLNYKLDGVLRNIILAMRDSQRDNGLIPDIAPEYVVFRGGFVDSPEWGTSAVLLPWYLYKWYGDRDYLADSWEMMTRYMDYLAGKAEGFILSHGLGDWCDLGPKDYGKAQLTPIALTATAAWYEAARAMVDAAKVLGRNNEIAVYEKLSEDIKTAFNTAFYDDERHTYATGSQTSLAMPLSLGLVPEEDVSAVEESLLSAIRDGGFALTSGDVGFHYLVNALGASRRGSETLFRMINRTDVPGYGYQLENGATALTESWPAYKNVSNNHLMLGHVMEWFYTNVLGVSDAPDAVASNKVIINPMPVGDITWAKGWYDTPFGRVSVSWTLSEDGTPNVEYSVPEGVTVVSKTEYSR